MGKLNMICYKIYQMQKMDLLIQYMAQRLKNINSILKESTSDAINNAKRVEKHHIDLKQAINNENCI